MDNPVDLARLEELQRFAELGRLSASLLHEISNPLTAAMLCLEQYDNQQSTFIRQARHNISLLQRYVKAARQQLRKESTVVDFSIDEQLDQLRQVFMPLGQSQGVAVHIATTASCRMVGDPVKFQQIIANLIRNSIDAYVGQNTAQLKNQVSVTAHDQGEWLVVEVVDRGAGITADQLPRIFRSFYTTKNHDNRGLGLGLALVKQYTEQDFGGSIRVTSSRRRGTRFVAKLRTNPSGGDSQQPSA